MTEHEPVNVVQPALVGRDRFLLARFLFVRMLAVVYAVAFGSLSVQILGLVGASGIQPAADYLEAARHFKGFNDYGFLPDWMVPYWNLPTIFWFNASDAALQGTCYLGLALSALLFCGLCPGFLLAILWVLYLSLTVAGQVFLQFQWDSLLLEAGLLAIFFAPWGWRSRLRGQSHAPALPRWLLIWLLFRLMVSSGLVKLIFDDVSRPTWRTLTALAYHYETQCIPNPIAWYVHQAPPLFGMMCTAMMFFIEIVTPIFFFFPRRWRHLAGASQILLQCTIMATGNYTYFNLLTITLCLLLFDDQLLRRVVPRLPAKGAGADTNPAADVPRLSWSAHLRRMGAFLIAVLLSAGVFAGGAIEMAKRVWPRSKETPIPEFVMTGTRWLSPFRCLNNYGLFTRMTTVRHEIEIQGSTDGVEWTPYVLPYQPGPVDRMPPQVAPHQPRLDWQMWFAALRPSTRRPRWFDQLMARLLDGEPSVLALLAYDPFPVQPPSFIRAVRYRYEFTDWETGWRTGEWWTREYVGPYTPVWSRY